MIYRKEDLENIIFFDIETIPKFKDYDDILMNGKLGEIEKVQNMAEKQGVELINDTKDFFSSIALIPELNQVICVSFGQIVFEKDGDGNIISKEKYKINLKSYASLNDELSILNDSFKAFNNQKFTLGGFNIINFDICVMQKHYLKHKMLPILLNTFGKKPWEIKVLDLCNDWKGSGGYLTSLSLLCDYLDVENPKNNEITGKNMTQKLLTGEATIKDVVTYCEKDVVAAIECCIKLTR